LVAGVFAWRAGWLGGEPPPPPHPLAGLEPSEFTAIVRLAPDGPQPLRGDQLRRAAAVIASLEQAPAIDSRAVVWGGAVLWRAVTRDGVVLSLQAKPIAGGVAVRVTADPAAGRPPATSAEAAAIRGLRLNAYRLSPDAGLPLLR
jgi:hypothetical protein